MIKVLEKASSFSLNWCDKCPDILHTTYITILCINQEFFLHILTDQIFIQKMAWRLWKLLNNVFFEITYSWNLCFLSNFAQVWTFEEGNWRFLSAEYDALVRFWKFHNLSVLDQLKHGPNRKKWKKMPCTFGAVFGVLWSESYSTKVFSWVLLQTKRLLPAELRKVPHSIFDRF